ncbi:MAG: sigma-70 family RNA polymerase sigma factor [Bacteroidales bacterium]|nr:sigma-70 family RNA polymerase sigma factor [Bacteroidales bacterium]MBS3774517.1 sigma-70 family RNA polymerase sigma factor [Bacteroidales bacterium]
MTDQEIIQGLKNKEETAFKEFVDTYQHLVLNVANKFVRNKEDAMDIAQEVFIKVYDSVHSFREQSKISTWLYKITVNKSLNYIRDKKRRNIFSSLDAIFENKNNNSMENVADDQKISQEQMESEERKEILFKAIDQLPEKQKTAITLNKLEGLPYKEIAGIMDISVTETGVLINRARKKLQKKLVAQFNPDHL